MSCSKPVPQFLFDSLYYLNRDQLDRVSIVCRPLKNFVERCFGSKPYRIFDRLRICKGSYALIHNNVQWYPNQEDYTVQQFFAGEKCKYYTFAEMRPYLGLTVRIKEMDIVVAASTYIPQHITEMESIAHLWRDGWITICNARNVDSLVGTQDSPLILNSPTILQCHLLIMNNPHFSFKDYKVMYSVDVIDINYGYEDVDLNYWQEFLSNRDANQSWSCLNFLAKKSIIFSIVFPR
ncbi:hypothetical protein DdX_21160 [Ditylenchus destructor]|uniref:F-box domain-containing protein n=1 Tax=Ditylenchus destructor TaxID=166010 RepID=A0AAD4MJJ9_9BILA|nr:hypothetical protein DdX_21160 [Ditylenchus destructor]